MSRTCCPECRQGKHDNCTVEVITPDDLVDDCACKTAGHPGGAG